MSDEDYEQGFSEGYDQGLSTDKEKSFLILAARIDELKKEITRLRSDLAAVTEERDMMRHALNKIAERHIPDQPASDGKDEADYVRTHYAQLRLIAKRAALQCVTEPGSHKGPDENLNLRNAECLPSTVAIMKPASPWRDIKSAPRDGTDFLALIPYNQKHHQMVGCFAPEGKFRSWPSRHEYCPTHWMPLPEPPR